MSKLSFIFCVFLLVSTSGFCQMEGKMDDQVMSGVFSVENFHRMVKKMEMGIADISEYPVIFPVKRESYENYTSSSYGKRLHPIHQVVKNHTGIDIPAKKGTAVYATGNGTVVKTGYEKGYGNYIEVEHAGGFKSFYAHLDKVIVQEGDTVSIGEHIACVGSTGQSTGYHLHYEIRKKGRFLNPMDWIYYLYLFLDENE